MWRIITFYCRYLMFYKSRHKYFEREVSEINRRRSHSSPYSELSTLDFNKYFDDQIEEAKLYWRV